MSQIPQVLEKLEGTSVYDLLVEIEQAYERISTEQGKWYEESHFTCPSGCGSCCKGFEPEIVEGGALYMAAWLIEHQRDVAAAVAQGEFPYDYNDGTCLFFDEKSPYHCTIYGGRAFICRLFGGSGYSSRTGDKVWRPCKFYPDNLLAAHKPPLEKRPYSQEETQAIFGTTPPLISDLAEGASCTNNNGTFLIHEILPQKIKWLFWLIDMNDNGNDNPNGTPAAA